MTVLLVCLLAILVLASLLVDWAANVLPTHELRRRSRLDPPEHKTARRLYNFKAYGQASSVWLWLVGTAGASALVLWSAEKSTGLAILTASAISLLVVNRRRLQQAEGILWSLAGLLAAGFAWLLHWLDPLLKKLSKASVSKANTGLFETADLEDLLKRQIHQPGNRINQEDLSTAAAALGFSTKNVAQVMTPMKQVRLVLPDEAIGPHLMDELHGSGYSSFPIGKRVGKKLPPQIQGTVYLKDLVTNSLKGTAGQVATDEVVYIEETRKLIEALETFLKTKSLLLIVQNEREEAVGALWLEDVLEQLLGRPIKPEIDNPADADVHQK